MDETYIMNDVKEACCYVSSNFKSDLETCRYDSPLKDSVSSDLTVHVDLTLRATRLFRNISFPTCRQIGKAGYVDLMILLPKLTKFL